MKVDKAKTGLYRKFDVRRADGTDAPGGKHDGCSYFVLDLTHDTHAIPAIRAYAKSCRAEFPMLAGDLVSLADGNPLMPTRTHLPATLEPLSGTHEAGCRCPQCVEDPLKPPSAEQQIAKLTGDLAQAQRSLDELHGAPFSQRVYVAMKARAEAAEQQLSDLRWAIQAIAAEMNEHVFYAPYAKVKDWRDRLAALGGQP